MVLDTTKFQGPAAAAAAAHNWMTTRSTASMMNCGGPPRHRYPYPTLPPQYPQRNAPQVPVVKIGRPRLQRSVNSYPTVAVQ